MNDPDSHNGRDGAARAVNQGWPARLRGAWYLGKVALWRLVWSRQTLISGLLLLFASLVVIVWSRQTRVSSGEFVEQIILPLYVSFLLPVFCLCYSTPSIAGEADERTLVYLLAAPLPRPLLFTAKYLAAGIAAAAWTLGSLVLLCRLAGPPGGVALGYVGEAAFWSTWAYVGLFHLFSVLFRRATIIALGYALFFEAFVANVPGFVKRVAISFYTHCAIFGAAEPLGMGPTGSRNPDLYQPVAGSTAITVLALASIVLFLLGAWLFTRREYA